MSEFDQTLEYIQFERIQEENNHFTNKMKVHKSMKRVQVPTVCKGLSQVEFLGQMKK